VRRGREIMQIETKIKDYIAKNLLFSEEGYTYADDVSFLQEGIIDSLGVMELVEFVQKEFGIKVEQTEVTPENFDSIAKLAAFVKTKQG
jgi:acyl carrier protein